MAVVGYAFGCDRQVADPSAYAVEARYHVPHERPFDDHEDQAGLDFELPCANDQRRVPERIFCYGFRV